MKSGLGVIIMKSSLKLCICFASIIYNTNAFSAENKFITISEYLKSRDNNADPYIKYVAALRCTIVFKIMDNIATKNNMASAAETARTTWETYSTIMSSYATKSNVKEDVLKDDLDRYYKIYEEALKNNYALTGSYFSEPTYADDVKTCKSIL